MLSIIEKLYDDYKYSLEHSADPRSRNWFLLQNNPVYVWVLTVIYLLIVWLGPKYMRDRKPYSLQWFMVVYNLGLVALSAYMFVELILSSRNAGYEWMCTPYNEKTRQDPNELRVVQVLWWYFFSKAIEFMDTILMVLRKRNRQITFLHVFHHATMLNIWWWVMMFIPQGLSYFGSGLNSFVHIVMYAYYGLSAIPSLRDKLWWKTYITQLQLSQFFITLGHTIYSIYSGCDFPLWGKNLLGGYMISMLVLFINFYVKSYTAGISKKRSAKGHENGAIAQNGSTQNGTTHINNHIVNGSATSKKSL